MFRTLVFFGLLALLNFVTHPLNAEESRAAVCAEKMRKFVKLMDDVLPKKGGHPLDFYQAVITEYLPAKGCNVEEVIAISRTSRFFAYAWEQHAFYVIGFKTESVVFSFGLRKDTGDIDLPNATWIEQSF